MDQTPGILSIIKSVGGKNMKKIIFLLLHFLSICAILSVNNKLFGAFHHA